MAVHCITVNISLTSVIVLLGFELENVYGCYCGGVRCARLEFPTVTVPICPLAITQLHSKQSYLLMNNIDERVQSDGGQYWGRN
jgi:hypothetical protein